MANRSILGTALLLAGFMTITPNATGQPRKALNHSDPAVEMASGIRTDRLSPKQLRVWAAIERIVFAKDRSGRFIHPKLRSLWQQAETSGHVIHVEMPGPRDDLDGRAGRFVIERFDPDGKSHTAVIRLCLPVIDGAVTDRIFRRTDGFIPFKGLGKEERYAEVLAHELAHAVWFLSDLRHARLMGDLDSEVDEFYNRRRHVAHGAAWDEQMERHLDRIESLTTEIERPAETAEKEIWQELLQNRPRKSDVTVSITAGKAAASAFKEVVIPGQDVSVTSTGLIASLLSTK
jgi:hypothetical protein